MGTNKDCCKSLTIDKEAVTDQGIEAHLGDTMGQLVQLPVELLSVQPMAHGIMVVGADGINMGGCPVVLRSGERGMWGLQREVLKPHYGVHKERGANGRSVGRLEGLVTKMVTTDKCSGKSPT